MQLFSFRNCLFASIFLVSGSVCSQDLGSETVEVVKPYTPSVNDAFKIRELPKITDTISLQKMPVQYSIFSVPVASTFTPAKGRAAELERERPTKVYDNYATLGFGNYTSVLAEFYSKLEVNRTDNFGIFLTHNSSQGGIEEVVAEDKYYDSELNLNYSSRTRKSNWNADAGFEHQLYNWYGVPQDFTPTTPDVAEELPQNYYSFHAGGELNLEDSFFERAKARYRFMGDTFSSAEHRLTFSPTLELPIAGELFKTNFLLDYVGGSFDRNLFSEAPINYGFLNVGLNSSLLVLRDDLTLNLGAALYYSMDTEESEGGLFVYPMINASYRVAGEYFIAYAALEGELKQNTYYQLTQDNPFVSPTLSIRPTDQQYVLKAGAKGKLSNSIGYDLRGSYSSEDFKPLFKANPQNAYMDNPEDYAHGNSFGVVYDKVNTLSAFGELSIDVNRNFNFRVNGEYFIYDTETEAEPWNLPDFKASLLADYQIGDSWFAGADLFLVGERKDQIHFSSFAPTEGTSETVVLDSFFDINARFGYRFNEQLSAFVKGHNLLGKNYERWMGFPVLGLQAMAGVTYKFDF